MRAPPPRRSPPPICRLLCGRGARRRRRPLEPIPLICLGCGHRLLGRLPGQGERRPGCGEAALPTLSLAATAAAVALAATSASLRRVSRRSKGRLAVVPKDGAAASQAARSVPRDPRLPSWKQPSRLTGPPGPHIAHCAAALRRGCCRAAASSALSRGSSLRRRPSQERVCCLEAPA